ncbi:MAG TPA: N-acetyltransferase, partial [Bdellovibrionota bacterium]|nr:N-acetyltransferase [Bdellovibrionota bacterium]
RVGGSFVLWSANFRYDELFALLFHAESRGDAEVLVQAGRRMAARLGLKRFRAWEDRPGSPWPDGGQREARTGSVPMLRGIAPGLEPADWNWVPRAVWL